MNGREQLRRVTSTDHGLYIVRVCRTPASIRLGSPACIRTPAPSRRECDLPDQPVAHREGWQTQSAPKAASSPAPHPAVTELDDELPRLFRRLHLLRTLSPARCETAPQEQKDFLEPLQRLVVVGESDTPWVWIHLASLTPKRLARPENVLAELVTQWSRRIHKPSNPSSAIWCRSSAASTKKPADSVLRRTQEGLYGRIAMRLYSRPCSQAMEARAAKGGSMGVSSRQFVTDSDR